MKIPRGDQSWPNKTARFMYGFYSGWLNKTIIGLIVVAPPAIIGALYSNTSLKKFIRLMASDDTYLSIAHAGKEHVLLFNSLSFIWPILLLTLGSEIAKRAQSNGLSVDSLLVLIKSLDKIVGIKDERFNTHEVIAKLAF